MHPALVTVNRSEAAIFDPENRIVYTANCTALQESYNQAVNSFKQGILSFPPNPVLNLDAPPSTPTDDSSHVLGDTSGPDMGGGPK